MFKVTGHVGPAFALAAVAGLMAGPASAQPRPAADSYLFNDSHFHLTNYVQKGTDIRDYLEIMGDKVGRSTLFGIPLQQTWSYENSGDYAPTYYLQIRRAALLLLVHRRLHRQRVPVAAGAGPRAARPDDHRLQSGRHVRGRSHPARAGDLSPACSPASASSRSTRSSSRRRSPATTASLTDPALDRMLDFAGEVGLVVILHNDIDMPFAKADTEPVYLTQMKDLLRRHPKTTIIWAHTGLGRVVHPAESQATPGRAGRSPDHLRDPRGDPRRPGTAPRLLRHLVGRGRQVRGRLAGNVEAHGLASGPLSRPFPVRHRQRRADRPGDASPGVPTVGSGLCAADAAGQRRHPQGQLRRLFDAARTRVRAWEKANVRK